MERKITVLNKSLVSEVELVYRSKVKAAERPMVSSSADSFAVLLNVWQMGKIELIEQFYVLYLNHANKVLAVALLSTGGITGTVADPRLIMIIALKIAATGIILAHSHPSGSLHPSRADIALTEKVKSGGAFLDIRLLDHLIVTKDQYYSFSDEGLL